MQENYYHDIFVNSSDDLLFKVKLASVEGSAWKKKKRKKKHKEVQKRLWKPWV